MFQLFFREMEVMKYLQGTVRNLEETNFYIILDGYRDLFQSLVGKLLINFSKFIIKNKLPSLKEICPSIKVCIVTAEMCTEEDRNLIEKAFGISIYREYGSSETSIIAIENKKLKWEISTDRLWVEVVDENNNILPNGELGRIILTDLNNKAFPFIRYDIGDFGRINKVNKYPYLLLVVNHNN